MKIDDTYSIDFADCRSVALVKKSINTKKGSKNFGEETVVVVGWYGNLEHALMGYLKAVSIEPARSATAMLKKLNNVEKLIKELNRNCGEEFKKRMRE